MDGKIEIEISSRLDPDVYNIPMTLKTYVPKTWEKVLAYPKHDPNKTQTLNIEHDQDGLYVLYSALIGQGTFVLAK